MKQTRNRKRLTHCKRGHEMTPENISTSPDGSRKCRICTRRRMQLKRAEWRDRTPTHDELNRQSERFFDKVDITATCWVWKASRYTDGYGQFNPAMSGVRAHRYAYELMVGPIPGGLVIDHLCRNLLCVNPDHLEPVTNKVNIMRGVGVAGWNATKLTCVHGHPLSGANLRTLPNGRRECIECRNRIIKANNQRRRKVNL